MLTNSAIDKTTSAILKIVATHQHRLSCEDFDDHEALRNQFKEELRKTVRDFGANIERGDAVTDEQILRDIAADNAKAFRSVATEFGYIKGPENDERFKDIVRQNQTEVEAILGAIPKAKAPFDPVSRRAALLATARSLRAHWGNRRNEGGNEYDLFASICGMLSPEIDGIPAKAFDPVAAARAAKNNVAYLIDHYKKMPKRTKANQLDLSFYERIYEQLHNPETPRRGFTVNSHPGYEPLAAVLGSALDRAAVGKGKERHANGKPFIEQPIFVLARIYGVGFLLGQAAKKLEECVNMPHDKAIAELKDVMVYSAAAIIHKESQVESDEGSDL